MAVTLATCLRMPIAMVSFLLVGLAGYGCGTDDPSGGVDAVPAGDNAGNTGSDAQDVTEHTDVPGSPQDGDDDSDDDDSDDDDVGDAALTDDADDAVPDTQPDGTADGAVQDVPPPLDNGYPYGGDGGLSGGYCPYIDAPAADANTGDVPQPDGAGCTFAEPAFFKGETPPKPTLFVELGVVGSDGVFTAYQDGQWVPFAHGVQCGFHMWTALRFKVPGLTEPKIKVQVAVTGHEGCAIKAVQNAPQVYPKLGGDGLYVVGDAVLPGLQMLFVKDPVTLAGSKSKDAWTYCNRWYDLRAAVREPKSGLWGQASVRVRAYDTQHICEL